MPQDLATRRVQTAAAAAHIGVARRTLEKWRWTGSGPPYYRVHGVIVYDTDELDAWLADRREPAPRPAPPQFLDAVAALLAESMLSER